MIRDVLRQHRTNTPDDTELPKVEHMYEELTRKVESILADSKHTAEGKAEAKRDAGREIRVKVEKWHAPLETMLAESEDFVLRDMHKDVAPPRPKDDVGAALLRQEVRRKAEGMDAQQVELLYRQGDANVRAALEEMPNITMKNNAVFVRQFVADEVREEVLLETARRQRPDLAKTLDGIRNKREMYQTLANLLRREVERVAPRATEPAKPKVVA